MKLWTPYRPTHSLHVFLFALLNIEYTCMRQQKPALNRCDGGPVTKITFQPFNTIIITTTTAKYI